MELFVALSLIVFKVALLIAILLLLPMPLTWVERKIAGRPGSRITAGSGSVVR
jgi:NADH-quinone oxidoreductase subunit H